MSGIAGIVDVGGARLQPRLIETMTAAMAHRGPDGIEHWTGERVALGHCMLHTTPESVHEAQPLANEDQTVVLTMDGRVDNWQELRRELLARDVSLRGRSDAELVLRAYETWGRDCLLHIDGDFALLVWDARRQRAFCARDRFGNKPLNYHWDGKTLAVASELHAILALPWVQQDFNEALVADYLNQKWLSREETPWKGVKRLLAAHWLEVGRDGLRQGEYWRPDFHALLRYRSDGEYVEHYREVFADTVRRLSRSQRKLAIEVSGGLDSSAIFAVAGMLRGEGRLAAPDMAGFTLDFGDDPDANDLEYARAVAAHVGIPVQEVQPKTKPLSWYRDWARRYQEFPGYPNGVMGADIREQAREQDCRALLVGVGGNEWLNGERTYYAEELACGHWRNVYDCLKADWRESGALRTGWWLARFGLAPLLPARVQDALRGALATYRRHRSDCRPWLSPRLRRSSLQRMKDLVVSYEGVDFGRAGQRRQYAIVREPFSVLGRELEERLAASFGVELRWPYWSKAMVQFAFATPERLRRLGEGERLLHRRAMAGLLPGLVLERTNPAHFAVAFISQAAEIKQTMAEEAARQRRHGWVRRKQMEQQYARYEDRSDAEPAWLVWSLLGWSALAAGYDGEMPAAR